MSDLVERLGKLQDSCNKQELHLLDTEYVFELAGRAADEIERQAKRIEELEARQTATVKWRQQTAELCEEARKERDCLKADNERLRAALRQILESPCDICGLPEWDHGHGDERHAYTSPPLDYEKKAEIAKAALRKDEG